jgi:predicted Zn-ribbon and HTH transcriptional regulator
MQMTEKHKAVKFEILGGEIADYMRGTFDTWKEVGDWIRNVIAPNAPRTGGYDKTDFRVTFADGETYSGRLDIKHPTCEDNDNDLASHILLYQEFCAGLFRPGWMSDEQWDRHLREIEENGKDKALQFLINYEIPKWDGAEIKMEFPKCENCGVTFSILIGETAENCPACTRNLAAEAKRLARQAEKEKDPLYLVSRGTRNGVTKKIKQLLKERSGKPWSVTGGRGTGWSWIQIKSPPSRTKDNLYGYMSPEDCRELARLMGHSRPVHNQGISDDEWYGLLCAARGDFSEDGKLSCAPHVDIACYILNLLLKGPITFEEILAGYDKHAHPALYDAGLNHALYHYTTELDPPEVVQLPDGRYVNAHWPGLENLAEPETAEEEPAEDPELRTPDVSGFTYAFKHEKTWTWVKFNHAPGDSLEWQFLGALKGIGFSYVPEKGALFCPEHVDGRTIADLFCAVFEGVPE